MSTRTKTRKGKPARRDATSRATATSEADALSTRLDEMHEILARKNAIIRLLAMGDCTASELGLSDV